MQALLTSMHKGQADFTLTFRRLSDSARDPAGDATFSATFASAETIQPWLQDWRQRLSRETATPEARSSAMKAANPAYIPRNHRIEQAIAAATDDGDFSLFEALVEVTAKPYEDQPRFAAYQEPPKPEEEVLRTFCGT